VLDGSMKHQINKLQYAVFVMVPDPPEAMWARSVTLKVRLQGGPL